MKDAAVGIIFKDRRRRILIVKRRDVPIWVLPGGGIESNELPEEAVVREFQEETGLRVVVVRKIAEYTPLNRLGQTVHLFEVAVIGGTPTINCEAKAIGFHPIDNLPIPFFSLHAKWVEDALKEERNIIKSPLPITYKIALTYAFKHPVLAIRWCLARLGIPINR